MVTFYNGLIRTVLSIDSYEPLDPINSRGLNCHFKCSGVLVKSERVLIIILSYKERLIIILRNKFYKYFLKNIFGWKTYFIFG